MTLVGAIETIGDSVAIQRVSWRRPRAVDFRAVQGAVGADGVGNLLSGLAGTVPNTTYSSSVAVTELTGVAARIIGVILGIVFIVLAFLPKALAVVLAIPGPVAAAYLTVLLAMLFVLGMKIVVQDRIDYRNGVVAGVRVLDRGRLPERPDISRACRGLRRRSPSERDDGPAGSVAILMTLFMELTQPRRRRIEVEFGLSALPKIRDFLVDFASRSRWDTAMANRLDAAGEETLLTLLQRDGESRSPDLAACC